MLHGAKNLRHVSLHQPACPDQLAAALASLPSLESAELSFGSVPSANSWRHLAALGSRLRMLTVCVDCPAPTELEAERQVGLVQGLQALAQAPRLELALCTDDEQPDDAPRLRGLEGIPSLAALHVEQLDPNQVSRAHVPLVVWDSNWRHVTSLHLHDTDLGAVDTMGSPGHRSPGWVGTNLSSLRRLELDFCDANLGCFPAVLCSLGQLTYLVSAGRSISVGSHSTCGLLQVT